MTWLGHHHLPVERSVARRLIKTYVSIGMGAYQLSWRVSASILKE
nr:hypothetical protein [Paenibacillus azoreducens]